MQFRSMIANLLISATIFSCVQPVTILASDITYDDTALMQYTDTATSGEIKVESIDDAVSNVEDLSIQIDDLYNKIGTSLNIGSKYVKILHLLAGGKAIYADKKPNIYLDETVKSMSGPFCIEGANTEYRAYQQVECPDQNIERPSSNYLPDAAYSVTYDIVQLMNERLNCDRGGEQIYFDSLKSSAKKEIIFTEAVLLYTGETEETVNNYYMIYEKLLYDKNKGEALVNIVDGKISIKDRYINTFKSNNITSKRALDYISIILSFDTELVNSDNSQSLSDEYVLPYIPNYTSRENMMIAATCLNGKVRYVWGGGHSGMSEIDGINPTWMIFEDLYADSETTEMLNEETGEVDITINESYDTCIKPSGSWCPNHGSSSGNCSFSGPIVYSLEDYIIQMDNYMDTTDLKTDKYSRLMSNVKFYNGVSVDTLNGLDCSGYVSWLYNQVTDRYNINTVAADFAHYPGLQQVSFGSKLLPGDIFAWSGHIVAIIGRTSDSDKVYVTTESTPNILKFGVVYYSGASESEIEYAKTIAREANQLVGNLYDREEPHVYCMNNYVDPSDDKNGRMGRFRDEFVDEDMVVTGYNKKIKDMYAQEIIQYILGKLPYSYVIGYNQYSGTIFDKSVVATDLGL